MKQQTQILHTPFSKKDPNNAMRMPLYDGIAFGASSMETLEDIFSGELEQCLYSRVTNPTVLHFEKTVAHLANAYQAMATSSGMAAIASVFLTICSSGDNIIASRFLFGNTHALFSDTLERIGIEVRWTDLSNLDWVEQLMDERTAGVFVESISNPQLQVVDLKRLSRITKAHHIPLICDITLSPPGCFDAQEHGVDIGVLSTSKQISGGGTSIGGMVIEYGTFSDWGKRILTEEIEDHNKWFDTRLRKVLYQDIGACISPHNAFLQTLGLETLLLRAERCISTALRLSEWLSTHPRIKKVNYPGLSSFSSYELAKKQFGKYTGILLTFEMESQAECYSMANKLQLLHRATNLGDNRSLIIHPASTIYQNMTDWQKDEIQVNNRMLRVSVGLEDIEDLIADFDQALKI